MSVLDQIIAQKTQEVAQRKQEKSLKDLEKSSLFQMPRLSLKTALKARTGAGFIAEFKRKSPSKGIINDRVSPEAVAGGYEQAGASAISVLTDEHFFGGSTKDLILAKAAVDLPVLRKDFIIDSYQLVEARAMGADLILLIAACLSPQQISELAEFAHSLELEVLMEVHTLEELERSLCPALDLVGVNNRNLKTFEVDIQTSLKLAQHIPDEFVKVSESGLSEVQTLMELEKAGYQAFLIGESFMKSNSPGKACADFVAAFEKSNNKA